MCDTRLVRTRGTKNTPRTRDTHLHILKIKVGRVAFILDSEAIVVTGSGSCTLSVPTSIAWIISFTILK